jgi:hypothetical protein
MAALTLYLLDQTAPGGGTSGTLQGGGTPPSVSTTGTGWAIDGTLSSPDYDLMHYGAIRASSTFAATPVLPGAAPGSISLWRTLYSYDGVLAAGTWTFAMALSASASVTATANLRVRVFVSTDPTGSTGLTELTTSTAVLSTASWSASSGQVNTTVTASLNGATLSGQYIFVAVALSIASTPSTAVNVVFVQDPTNSVITTPSFFPTPVYEAYPDRVLPAAAIPTGAQRSDQNINVVPEVRLPSDWQTNYPDRINPPRAIPLGSQQVESFVDVEFVHPGFGPFYLIDSFAYDTQTGVINVGGQALDGFSKPGVRPMYGPGQGATTSGIATGWTVGTTAASNYSLILYRATRLASTFASTVLPNAAPNTTGWFRTQNTITGFYPAGNWSIKVAVIAQSITGSPAGNLRMTFWKGTAGNGSNAVQIGAATVALTTATLSTSQSNTTGTWTAPEFGCADEYIFFVMAWEVTVASTSATCDVIIVQDGTNSVITPTAFQPVETITPVDQDFPDIVYGRPFQTKLQSYFTTSPKPERTQVYVDQDFPDVQRGARQPQYDYVATRNLQVERPVPYFSVDYPERVRGPQPRAYMHRATIPLRPERTSSFFPDVYQDQVLGRPFPAQAQPYALDVPSKPERTQTLSSQSFPDVVPGPQPRLQLPEAERTIILERTSPLSSQSFPDVVSGPQPRLQLAEEDRTIVLERTSPLSSQSFPDAVPGPQPRLQLPEAERGIAPERTQVLSAQSFPDTVPGPQPRLQLPEAERTIAPERTQSLSEQVFPDGVLSPSPRQHDDVPSVPKVLNAPFPTPAFPDEVLGRAFPTNAHLHTVATPVEPERTSPLSSQSFPDVVPGPQPRLQLPEAERTIIPERKQALSAQSFPDEVLGRFYPIQAHLYDLDEPPKPERTVPLSGYDAPDRVVGPAPRQHVDALNVSLPKESKEPYSSIVFPERVPGAPFPTYEQPFAFDKPPFPERTSSLASDDFPATAPGPQPRQHLDVATLPVFPERNAPMVPADFPATVPGPQPRQHVDVSDRTIEPERGTPLSSQVFPDVALGRSLHPAYQQTISFQNISFPAGGIINGQGGSWYPLYNTTFGGSNFGELQDGGFVEDTTFTTGLTGMVPQNASPVYADTQFSVTSNGSFSSTVRPSAAPTNSLANTFVTPYRMWGNFASGTWTFGWKMTTNANVGVLINLRVRIWASHTVTVGSDVREITSSVIVSGSATVSGTWEMSATWAAPAFYLDSEYLYFELAWEQTTPTGGGSTVVMLQSAATFITPTLFTPVVPWPEWMIEYPERIPPPPIVRTADRQWTFVVPLLDRPRPLFSNEFPEKVLRPLPREPMPVGALPPRPERKSPYFDDDFPLTVPGAKPRQHEDVASRPTGLVVSIITVLNTENAVPWSPLRHREDDVDRSLFPFAPTLFSTPFPDRVERRDPDPRVFSLDIAPEPERTSPLAGQIYPDVMFGPQPRQHLDALAMSPEPERTSPLAGQIYPDVVRGPQPRQHLDALSTPPEPERVDPFFATDYPDRLFYAARREAGLETFYTVETLAPAPFILALMPERSPRRVVWDYLSLIFTTSEQPSSGPTTQPFSVGTVVTLSTSDIPSQNPLIVGLAPVPSTGAPTSITPSTGATVVPPLSLLSVVIKPRT